MRSLNLTARIAVLGLTMVLGACGLKKPPAVSPAVPPRVELIEDIQVFQHTLGLEPTGNFQRYSDAEDAVDRCYFTGPLELPASYSELHLAQETKERVGSSRVDLQACKLEYSIVSPK